jgi:hypothetical protein
VNFAKTVGNLSQTRDKSKVRFYQAHIQLELERRPI